MGQLKQVRYPWVKRLVVPLLATCILIPIRTGHAGAYKNLNEILQELKPVVSPTEGPDRQRSIDLYVTFRTGSSDLSNTAENQLDELAAAISHSSLANYKFIVAGHTDASGPADFNKRLSNARAVTVKQYLVLKRGIAGNRLKTVGWGEEKLKTPLLPRDASNRRVEITTISDAGSELLLGKSKSRRKW